VVARHVSPRSPLTTDEISIIEGGRLNRAEDLIELKTSGLEPVTGQIIQREKAVCAIVLDELLA